MSRNQLIALFLTVHFAWAGWISLAVIDIKTALAESKAAHNQKAQNEVVTTNGMQSVAIDRMRFTQSKFQCERAAVE